MTGAIPILYGHLVIHPPAAFPSSQDHGKRPLHPEREAGPLRQVAEERVSFLYCCALHGHQLGWGQRLGQVCVLRRELRLVGPLSYQCSLTHPYVSTPNLVSPSATFTRRCFITKHVHARGRRKCVILPLWYLVCWRRCILPHRQSWWAFVTVGHIPPTTKHTSHRS